MYAKSEAIAKEGKQRHGSGTLFAPRPFQSKLKSMLGTKFNGQKGEINEGNNSNWHQLIFLPPPRQNPAYS